MSPNKLNVDFAKVSWKDVREEVYTIKPDLCEIIDAISPSEKFSLVKIKYPFGSLIIDNGHISQKYCKCKDCEKLIQSELQYSKIPLGLLLDKSSEVFVQFDNRIVPLNLLNKGDFFGTFEVMNSFAGVDTESPWSVSAGMRSIFFLQKISNHIGQQRLKKAFGFNGTTPQNFNEQWQTFVDIVNADNKQQWNSNVLFFTKNWFDKRLTDTPEWYKFREYLSLESWKKRYHLIEQPITSSLWRIFSSAIQNRKLRPKPYILDTIKHLLLISQAVSPAFMPINEEHYAPINMIKNIYYDVYKLNILDYYPTIMGIGLLDKNIKFLYYSLNYPTLYEGHYEKASYNFIAELREIKLALDTLYRHLDIYKDSISKEISNSINKLRFDYFHRSHDNYDELNHSNTIINDDKRFIEIDSTYNNDFCNNSPFFSGCVRISNDNDI